MSGTYLDTVPNAVNCDSVITLNLTINQATSSTLNETACTDYTWAQTGVTYTMSGSYLDTVPNAVNCDSVITLNLTINNNYRDTIPVIACNFYTWSENSITYYQSGIYSDTATTVNGCDSILNIDLIINNTQRDSMRINACGSYLWAINNMSYTTTGVYLDTVPAISGCDSINVLILVIDTVNSGITQSGLVLSSNQLGATYQWLDCNNGNAPITGANSQSYTVTVNGNYAVEIGLNSCTDTSICTNIINVGVEQLELNSSLSLYPNPTKSSFTIELGQQTNYEILQIFDLSGNLIKEQQIQSNKEVIDVSKFADGIYMVKYGDVIKKLILMK
jgi:hypothetical protein